MRGAFNTTCDVSHGPRSVTGPPGVQYAAGVPCRFVPQTRIGQAMFPLLLSHAWLTNDSLDLVDPFVSSPFLGATFTDWLAADTVVVASVPGKTFLVCREEAVNPFEGLAYLRWLLIDIDLVQVPPWLPPSPPPPPPSPPPGSTCATADSFTLDTSESHVISGAEQQWFAVPITVTDTYYVKTTETLGSVTTRVLVAPCPGTQINFTPGTQCTAYFVNAGDTLLVEMECTGSSGYDLEIGTGMCPP